MFCRVGLLYIIFNSFFVLSLFLAENNIIVSLCSSLSEVFDICPILTRIDICREL